MKDLPEVITTMDSVQNDNGLIVRTSSAHKLKDGDEIKISGVEGLSAANRSGFVKTSGHDAKSFALYEDAGLTNPVAAPGKYEKGGTIYFPFPDDHAIIVGINHYPAFKKALEGAETDAKRFREWLVSSTGGMVRSTNVRTILSSDYPYQPSHPLYSPRPALSDFRNEFSALREKSLRATDPQYRIGRRIYLFFSGHGITPARAPSPDLDDAALLMANASVAALDEHVPGHPYAEWLRNAAAFDEVVLIMDCCRDLPTNVSSIGPTPPIISDRRSEVRRFYAVATELDSKSWEQKFNGGVHGVFSWALMEALEQDNICDAQGRLTATRLKTYLETRISEIRPDQVPRIFPPPDSQNDIVFRARRTSVRPNVRITFGSGLQGKKVELIGRNYPTADDTHIVDDLPWPLNLPNGLYKLRIDGEHEGRPWELRGNEVEIKDVQFPDAA